MDCMNEDIQGCNRGRISSWNDLQNLCPIDPVSIIKYADIGGSVGMHTLSSNYLDPGAAWATCTATISSEPDITALETDNQQMVADAAQWNFTHLTWKGDAAVAIPLRRLIFLRGGLQWSNHIAVNSGGDPIQDVQLSLLINAATRGDMQSTIPVIQWTGLGSQDIDLHLTILRPGLLYLGLWLYNGTNYQMMDIYVNAKA